MNLDMGRVSSLMVLNQVISGSGLDFVIKFSFISSASLFHTG